MNPRAAWGAPRSILSSSSCRYLGFGVGFGLVFFVAFGLGYFAFGVGLARPVWRRFRLSLMLGRAWRRLWSFAPRVAAAPLVFDVGSRLVLILVLGAWCWDYSCRLSVVSLVLIFGSRLVLAFGPLCFPWFWSCLVVCLRFGLRIQSSWVTQRWVYLLSNRRRCDPRGFYIARRVDRYYIAPIGIGWEVW